MGDPLGLRQRRPDVRRAERGMAARHARERFHAGIDNFLDVLDAERTLLEAQDRLVRAETETALELVAIYKPLGGGWEAAL